MCNIETATGLELYYIGMYYDYVKHDLSKEIRYLEMAVEKGCDHAMNALGVVYGGTLDKAMRYYEMAAEKNNISAINNLACLYSMHYNDYDKAIELCQRGLELNNATLISQLSFCYLETDNIELYLKYGLMAIEMGNCGSIPRMSQYFKCNKKDYTDLIIALYKGNHISEHPDYKSCLLWADCWLLHITNDFELTAKLIEHLVDIDPKLLEMLPKVVQKLYTFAKAEIDIMELHFNYAPGQAGFESAKTDFIDKLGNC